MKNNNYIYVLAATHEEAINFIRDRGDKVHRLKYISSHITLRGIDGRGQVLHVLETALERTDIYELRHIAMNRGFKLRHV